MRRTKPLRCMFVVGTLLSAPIAASGEVSTLPARALLVFHDTPRAEIETLLSEIHAAGGSVSVVFPFYAAVVRLESEAILDLPTSRVVRTFYTEEVPPFDLTASSAALHEVYRYWNETLDESVEQGFQRLGPARTQPPRDDRLDRQTILREIAERVQERHQELIATDPLAALEVETVAKGFVQALLAQDRRSAMHVLSSFAPSALEDRIERYLEQAQVLRQRAQSISVRLDALEGTAARVHLIDAAGIPTGTLVLADGADGWRIVDVEE